MQSPPIASRNRPDAGLQIRDARLHEFDALGRLLVDVYAQLEGFPGPAEQPRYYEMLADIGQFTAKPDTRLLVAVDSQETLLGGVVYFADMAQYGSGGVATTLRDASGIRLLGIATPARGRGVGKALTQACIALARESGHAQVVLHTTEAMRVAWGMYERLGFVRAQALDFLQGSLPVYGFSLSVAAPDEARVD